MRLTSSLGMCLSIIEPRSVGDSRALAGQLNAKENKMPPATLTTRWRKYDILREFQVPHLSKSVWLHIVNASIFEQSRTSKRLSRIQLIQGWFRRQRHFLPAALSLNSRTFPETRSSGPKKRKQFLKNVRMIPGIRAKAQAWIPDTS